LSKEKVNLTGNINQDSIIAIQKRVDDNSKLIEYIVDDLVEEYCKQLDDYMIFIKDVLSDINNPPNSLELDDFIMNLPVLMYFTSSSQESLGIKEDIIKAIKQEIYSVAYDMNTGTVATRTAAAELASQNESIALIAYQRAYKKVKGRMDSAMETLNSIKKVISRRIAEYGISQNSGNTDGRLHI